MHAKGGTYVGLLNRRRHHEQKSAECDRWRIRSAAAPSMEILNDIYTGELPSGDLDMSLPRTRLG